MILSESVIMWKGAAKEEDRAEDALNGRYTCLRGSVGEIRGCSCSHNITEYPFRFCTPGSMYYGTLPASDQIILTCRSEAAALFGAVVAASVEAIRVACFSL
jgi:hypothetical protein